MRDPTHREHVQRWAAYVKKHPKTWKKIHTGFIDAQYELALGFLQRLARTKGGKKKLERLKALKLERDQRRERKRANSL